eukprot:NODE_6349_length_1680_cov_3.637476.p2 GENE.NODE_6349_length_1680_cov_3.637476~~NODE_6349_length_1680_cov_3.637476.p2  ORF type:complete len:333 (-),score=83.54 NODE_6349_length_1680_cov_3.637476:499-1497(-)
MAAPPRMHQQARLVHATSHRRMDSAGLRRRRLPPAVARPVGRALEATYLLLNASKTSKESLAPPAWDRVQRMLSDANFMSRMAAYSASTLSSAPHLSTYVAAEYFGRGLAVEPTTAEDVMLPLAAVEEPPPSPCHAQVATQEVVYEREAPPAPVKTTPIAKPSVPVLKSRWAALRGLAPDRHFELLAAFDLGYAVLVPEGVAALQTLAATICMRQRLQIEIVSWPHRLESVALGTARLQVVQTVLAKDGLTIVKMHEQMRTPSSSVPAVVCQVHVRGDRELSMHFLSLSVPKEPDEDDYVCSKEAREVAGWLEENFTSTMHPRIARGSSEGS